MRRHPALYLILLLLVVTGSGASCPRRGQTVTPTAPVVFGGTPTIQDAIDAVNANTASVQQLHTDTATLSLKGMPSLRSSIALQRPRDFRLRANFIGMGQVLDMGSNDEVFWALVDAPQFATNMPRAVYYARHDQFRHSASRHVLPIQPHWLIEAFGVLRLDPNAVYEGPYARAPGQMEIRARTYSPDGDITKIIVLDDRFAWILEQHWYDHQGQLIASVFSGDHQYDSDFRVSLPHHIDVRLARPQDSFQIDVERYAINQLYSDPAQLWGMPEFAGYQRLDLAAGPPGAPPAGAPPAAAPYTQPVGSVPTTRLPPGDYPHTGYRPQYRGYTATR